MQTLKFRLTGTRPLLMHADTFSDPLNPLTKAHKQLTGKRKKTEDDHEAIAQSEWRGSLYYDEELGPYMPGVNVEACMVAGGKLQKLGTTLKRAAEVWEDKCRLKYKGPRDPEAMWDAQMYDARSVVVQRQRLMRYRPIFRDWSLECTVVYDETAIDRSDIIKCLTDGGQMSGLGDYRPKFGRFEVEVLDG